jgi:hypothetical protein
MGSHKRDGTTSAHTATLAMRAELTQTTTRPSTPQATGSEEEEEEEGGGIPPRAFLASGLSSEGGRMVARWKQCAVSECAYTCCCVVGRTPPVYYLAYK